MFPSKDGAASEPLFFGGTRREDDDDLACRLKKRLFPSSKMLSFLWRVSDPYSKQIGRLGRGAQEEAPAVESFHARQRREREGLREE
jgi:hypothetical protein